MDVTLTPDLKRFVRAKVKSGEYPDANAVVRGALEMPREQDELIADDLVQLRPRVRSDSLPRSLSPARSGRRSGFTCGVGRCRTTSCRAARRETGL